MGYYDLITYIIIQAKYYKYNNSLDLVASGKLFNVRS